MALNINDTEARRQYVATSGQTVFAVPFTFFEATELLVYNGDTLLSYASSPANASQYSVTGADNDLGGSITLGAPGATLNDVITIIHNVPVERVTDFPLSGPFNIESLNEELSKIVAMIRQVATSLGRKIGLSTTDTGDSVDLPNVADRAGLYLAFDAQGRPTVSSGTGNDSALRTDLAAADGSTLVGGLRERLSATRTYYVRTDGSDANNGLTNTGGGAFLTIQKAIDTIYELDLNGNMAIVQVAAGTYTGSISIYGLLYGAGDDQPLRIIGDEVTPANVIISTTSANAINVGNGGYVLLAGFQIQTTTSGIGLSAFSNAMVEHRNLRFGACANEMILTQHHATVRALGATTVVSNAQYFCHATKRSIIDFAGQTITFVGTPTFSNYLWGINDASVNLDSGTIVGAAVGPILVHKNGSLNASSLTGSYLGGTAPVFTDGGLLAVQDLLETRALYVRTDGDDDNDGLANTAGRAFRTIQAAVNFLSKLPYNPLWWTTALDSGFTIYVADGTYAETVNLRDVRAVGATIHGNEDTPANVVVAGVSDGFVGIGLNTKWYLRGLKITATSGSAIRLEQGSQVAFRAIDFGNCSSAHIFTQTKSVAIAEGNYSITSNALWHKIARTGSAIVTSDRTVTLTGTPNFSQSYALADDTSLIRCVSMTFSGSATGARYSVTTNGVINTNGGGATYLPGNSAGSSATGGQYV